MHSERMTAPRGWEIVRIAPDPDALKPSSDDLEALANAVREAARPRYVQPDRGADSDGVSGSNIDHDNPGHRRNGQHSDDSSWGARRGHLRVIHSSSAGTASTEVEDSE